MTKKIQVILTPALSHLYELQGANVVVIDILRATTSMCEAFKNGAAALIPVANINEAKTYKSKGFAVAAERNGIQVDGFDFGNSPFSFTSDMVKDKTIVFTTTNGTRCIDIAQEAGSGNVYIGAFLNLDALVSLLKKADKDLYLFCAGWKDKFNLEDTLFAGALVAALKNDYAIDDDACEMALDLFDKAKDNLVEYVKKASHSKRFDKLGITGDASFCMQMNTTDMVPYLKGIKLVVK